jgi:uncharacterized protein involved in response to NO
LASRDRSGDIPLEAPLVRHADVVPAVEDRSYVAFIGGAVFMALAGGFASGVLVSFAAAGAFWETRVPWLTQAHGWAQLEGWAGLFVAGMGLRLFPRFAGRRPVHRPLNLAVFGLLFGGVALRTVTQPLPGDLASAAGLLAGQVLWAAGAVVFAALLGVVLVRGRGRHEPWRVFAMAGAGCWVAWAAGSVAAGIRGARNEAFVPTALDDPLTWVAMLGAVGNFIWAVQSRSVPIFFGRKTPRLGRVAAPGIALNAGVALLFAACWLDAGESHARLTGAGFLLAAGGIAWLAPIAGSCWGTPRRLRPRARAAARFVLAANIAAVLCAVLLAWAGVRTLQEEAFAAPGARDAARHAFGAGVITLLIVGMAQLVAPFFALRRVEGRGRLSDHAVFAMLVSAALLRVLGGLLTDRLDLEPRMHLNAVAGTLAWLGLALFATTAWRAFRDEPRVAAALAAGAAPRSGSSPAGHP